MSGKRPHENEEVLEKKKMGKRIDKEFSCIWGYSSAGGALEWHSRGRGFESHNVHLNYKSRSGMLVA
jgi:hypothetical protein